MLLVEVKRKSDEEAESVRISPFITQMSDLKPVLSQHMVPLETSKQTGARAGS